ncbi:hypothetical protein ACFL59_05585 [Planctomycetota bacterium]
MHRIVRTVARVALAGTLLCALTATSGCIYMHDRLKDTVDIVGAKVLAGPGSKVGIGVGAAKTGLNLGYYRFEKFGFQGRAMGVVEETGLEILAPADHSIEAVWGNRELFDMVQEYKKIDGAKSRASLFDTELTYPRRRFHVPDGFHLADPTPFGVTALSLGDVQFTFAPLFVGFELNFSLYQLVDWALGWFYIDIAKDDNRNYKPLGPPED